MAAIIARFPVCFQLDLQFRDTSKSQLLGFGQSQARANKY